MSQRSPLLMANVIFSAIVIGVVAGVGLRGQAESPETGNTTAPESPPAWVAGPPQSPDDLTSGTAPEAAADDGSFDVAWQAPPAAPGPAASDRGAIGMFSFADIVERVSPAVVTVTSTRRVDAGNGDGIFDRFFGNRQHPDVEGHGSGFIIRDDGVILTNNHVVENADDLRVRLGDGREFDAEIVGRDPQTDVAVLRIEADGLPTLTLGDSDRMRVGDWVLAVGSPFRRALETSVTSGIISGKGRGSVGIVEYEEFLQTDAAINPGNSGGPLINLEGNVIGINTAIATRNGGYQGVSFAIPVNFAKPIVQALLDDGRVRRAWLGVSIQDVTPELALGLEMQRPEGVAIVEVYEDMPADQAGLRSGDVVLSMDRTPTPNSSFFRNRVSLSHPGQRVEFEILRDGNVRRVDVVLGELTDTVLAQVQTDRRAVPVPAPGNENELFGMELTELTTEGRQEYHVSRDIRGVLVTRVARGSAAAEAGLEAGDVIRAVNRRDVESVRDFSSALRGLPRDRPIVLNVKRRNQSFFVTLDPSS